MMKWLGRLFWFVLGGVIALTVAGFVAWEYIGSIALVGGMAQGIIKRKAIKAMGLEKAKKVGSRFRGFSFRKRG